MTAIDDSTHFRRSRDVAAYFGLTSRRWQSGTSIDVQGRISTRFKGTYRVKSWCREIAKRSCHRKACVALARKLAVIMHAMWSDGTFCVGDLAASGPTPPSVRRSRTASCWERIDERCGGR
jgi:hypothetical protein